MPGLIGQVYPIAPVAPNSVNDYALNVPELQAAGLLPTAWCVFDGTLTGTNAPIAGYNVASVTINSVGSYTINLINDLDNGDCSIAGSCNFNNVIDNDMTDFVVDNVPTIAPFNSVSVTSHSHSSNVRVNALKVYVQVFGGKN